MKEINLAFVQKSEFNPYRKIVSTQLLFLLEKSLIYYTLYNLFSACFNCVLVCGLQDLPNQIKSEN